MAFDDVIKELKERHSKMVIEKAKSEERLASLQEQKDKIYKQCETLGIAPKDLTSEKERIEKEIKQNLAKARELMGIDLDVQEEDFDTPF